MTEIEYLAELHIAAGKLARDELDVKQFEKLCTDAATRRYGPPPEGREYVAAVVETRLVVGHRAIEPEHHRVRLVSPWEES